MKKSKKLEPKTCILLALCLEYCLNDLNTIKTSMQLNLT